MKELPFIPQPKPIRSDSGGDAIVNMTLVALAVVAIVCGVFISYVAHGQTLTPVTAPAGSGFPWWGWPIAGVVLAILVFMALRKWWPAAATKVAATAGTDAAALGKLIADALAHAKANPAPEPAAVTVTLPDLKPELDTANGKLAQIKAIVEG